MKRNITLMYDHTEELKMEILHNLYPFTPDYESYDVKVFTLSESKKAVVKINDYPVTFDLTWYEDLSNPKILKRFLSLCVYKALSCYFDKELPWGSITGVRPGKLAYEFVGNYGSYDRISEFLRFNYLVTRPKADLMEKIMKNQQKFIHGFGSKVNLYIHIPFCNTRCAYCSFPSVVCNGDKLLNEYFEYLIKETEETVKFIHSSSREILSVYIGGGTPSVLSCSQIERLLHVIDFNGEITFEAGREDSLTEEKIDTLYKCGVRRICINPQTFNEKTLKSIGRNQDNLNLIRLYNYASGKGLNVNMDIIAGLKDEALDDFKNTVDKVLELKPTNVTVHTLCIKKGSEYAGDYLVNSEINEMMELAIDKLGNCYEPYYLYRQKHMAGGLENIGFASSEATVCINNISVMEEFNDVYACGAGGISKIITERDIKRMANIKDIKLYISRFNDRLNEKLVFYNENK